MAIGLEDSTGSGTFARGRAASRPSNLANTIPQRGHSAARADDGAAHFGHSI
jgi:hypothetical protein